jgi:hypothetical protein
MPVIADSALLIFGRSVQLLALGNISTASGTIDMRLYMYLFFHRDASSVWDRMALVDGN